MPLASLDGLPAVALPQSVPINKRPDIFEHRCINEEFSDVTLILSASQILLNEREDFRIRASRWDFFFIGYFQIKEGKTFFACPYNLFCRNTPIFSSNLREEKMQPDKANNFVEAPTSAVSFPKMLFHPCFLFRLTAIHFLNNLAAFGHFVLNK